MQGETGTFFPCLCAVCGNPAFILFGRLTENRTSCNCAKGNVKHRASRKDDPVNKRLYGIWSSMRDRVNNSRAPHFARYGGRGVNICAEWDDFAVFKQWALSNGYHESLTLDRIDNDGNYEPSNCRWATREQQSRNRSSTYRLEWDGESKSLAEWCQDPRCVVGYHTAYQRINKGWSVEMAVTTPAWRKAKSSLGGEVTSTNAE